MGLLSRLLLPLRRRARTPPPEASRGPRRRPGEPHVFECASCGKVFDAARFGVPCPECDSADVLLLTD